MGIRGVPAHHGGFETFAERLAPYLARCGWDVTVYCQEEGHGPLTESEWQGVRRVHISVGADTAFNSMKFDWACIQHAVRDRAPLVLTLGYNTAVFGLRLRAAGICHVINMDGIEWARDKWGPAGTRLAVSERLGRQPGRQPPAGGSPDDCPPPGLAGPQAQDQHHPLRHGSDSHSGPGTCWPRWA